MTKRKLDVDEDGLNDNNKKLKSDSVTTNAKKFNSKIRKLPPPLPLHQSSKVMKNNCRQSSISNKSSNKISNVLNITRKTNLMNYLNRSKNIFFNLGYQSLIINSLSAAIPHSLKLLSLIKSNLPVDDKRNVNVKILTNTVKVNDEVIPNDKELDVYNQSRYQSALTIIINLDNGDGDNHNHDNDKSISNAKKSSNKNNKDNKNNKNVKVKKDNSENDKKINNIENVFKSISTKPRKNRGVKRRLKDEAKQLQRQQEIKEK